MAETPHLSDEAWLEAVREAHAVRAAFYYGMFCELRCSYGEERALELIGRVCRDMGLAKRDRYRRAMPDEDPTAFCTFFCTHGPVNGKIFEMSAHGTTVHLGRCALVDGWRAQNVPAEDIAKLCRAAREVDHGTLEGLGYAGTFETLLAEDGDCCRLAVRRIGSGQQQSCCPSDDEA